MGSLERVREEKGELFRRMRQDGTILVNQDDPSVIDLASEFHGQKITFGIDHPAEVMAKDIRLQEVGGTSFTLMMEGVTMEITLPFLGGHFVPNALSAIAVASLFGIELEKVKEALEHLSPCPMRMEVLRPQEGVTLINDAYNANPRSMELALEILSQMKGKGRGIAVLGDMLELGEYSVEAHQLIGKRVGELSIDFLLALGEEAPVLVESAMRHGLDSEKARIVESHTEAISILKKMVQDGDWILVKGSRRVGMEKIAEGLMARRV
jgi:UDP-N-acetylmuramoyl-tripeptide--D-alanyl-D-alanine ligase